MNVKGNENSRLQRRIAICEPEAVNAVSVPELDMQAILALDDVLSRKRSGFERKAIFETCWRWRDDQRCRVELREPDWIGFRGW